MNDPAAVGFKDQTIFAQAVWFAAEAHCNALRKGTDTPYLIHLMETAVIASGMTSDPVILAAAMLHDSVEDTQAQIEDIERAFGPEVAKIVAAMTEDKRSHLPPEETWLLRKREYIDHLRREAGEGAKIVALADKLSNIRAIAADCRKIGEEVWLRFNQKDKAMHEWYYRSALDALREFREQDAWKELSSLIDTVFGHA